MALLPGSCVASPAPAGVFPGPRGDTVSTGVALGLSALANVPGEAGGVGAVQPVASLAAAGVAALQVDAEPVLEGAVMTLRPPHHLTLVHVLTVSSVTLHTTSSQSQPGTSAGLQPHLESLVAVAGIVKNSVLAFRLGVTVVSPGTAVQL